MTLYEILFWDATTARVPLAKLIDYCTPMNMGTKPFGNVTDSCTGSPAHPSRGPALGILPDDGQAHHSSREAAA